MEQSNINVDDFLRKYPTFVPESISDTDLLEFSHKLRTLQIDDIGIGRAGGFDPSILMKKIVYLCIKSRMNKDLFIKLVKTFGIKFCIHGTRIKPDNQVIIENKTYTAVDLSTLLEFRQSGKQTDSTQITPTRLARIFATDAVNFMSERKLEPPMFQQESLKVLGLPESYHFLSAIYAVNSIAYKQALINLGKNFDTMMSDLNNQYDRKNGFAVRFAWFFEHYPDYLRSTSEFYKIVFATYKHKTDKETDPSSHENTPFIIRLLQTNYDNSQNLNPTQLSEVKANFLRNGALFTGAILKIATMYIDNNGIFQKLDKTEE